MSTSPPAPPCSALAIVVVDDDDAFRTALAENLRDDGHPVTDHDDPLAVGSLDGVAALLTDYEMPRMNGLAFAELVHAAHPSVLVVLITAYWTAELEEALRARPFVRLQRKPVDYESLHGALHAWIASPGGGAARAPR